MTKIWLLQPKDSEPKELLEQGSQTHENELAQMESGLEKRVKSGEIGKLNFLLIWTSPFPIYIFLFFLFAFDKCFQVFDPIHITLLLGFIASFELLSVLLFCPPKHAGNSNVEMIEFERTDYKAMSLSKLQYVHAFVTLITLWLFVDGGIIYICFLVARDHIIPLAGVGFLAATFVSYKIYRSLRNRTWLNGFASHNIMLSIFLQVYACYSLVFAFLYPGGFTSLLIASFTLLAAVSNLRFLYNFENPPKTKCMLTMVHTRKFLAQWWQWIALMNGVLWAGLLLLILLPSSSPYEEPRSRCVQSTTSILIIFCSAIPIMFVLTIVSSCVACCFKRS